jgi:hypothetical protein
MTRALCCRVTARQVISSLDGESVDAKKSFCIRNELELDLFSAMTNVYMKSAFMHPSNFRQAFYFRCRCHIRYPIGYAAVA